MSPEQKRKIEEACEESYEKTMDVNAAGDKAPQNRYSDSPNQINNE